jgi:hypothetical protein
MCWVPCLRLKWLHLVDQTPTAARPAHTLFVDRDVYALPPTWLETWAACPWVAIAVLLMVTGLGVLAGRVDMRLVVRAKCLAGGPVLTSVVLGAPGSTPDCYRSLRGVLP